MNRDGRSLLKKVFIYLTAFALSLDNFFDVSTAKSQLQCNFTNSVDNVMKLFTFTDN